jgi:hypothetical protein
MELDLKSYALTVTSFLGQPNLEKIYPSRKSMITLSVAFQVGIASIHFVK